MKKPAAAMKKKKRHACMKMCRKILLQKWGRREGKEEKTKQKKNYNVVARAREVAKKQKRKKDNVVARARKAARNGKSYQARASGPLGLKKVAAVAHAAAVKSGKAMKRADGAHEAADVAKKDAVCARAMAFQNGKRITRVEETLTETMARVRKNEERLDVDDRQSGHITPEERLNVDNRQGDSTPLYPITNVTPP
jgi:hypothetical protein